MYRPAVDWNSRQTRLRECLCRQADFAQAITLCLSLHAFAHRSVATGVDSPTLGDLVFEGLADADYSIMPTPRDDTIAWHLWHITRIEDLTMNLLVNDGHQVLTPTWQKKLGTAVTDTGNAMTDSEIISLSKELDKAALWDYRAAVCRRSREIVGRLRFADLTRKFTGEQAARIVEQGGLTKHPDSIWLRDFWGKKTVAGILLLPLTRHQAGHLNSCLQMKAKIAKRARSSSGQMI